ncbi:MAG: thioredoxin domain-containing protein, partial [Methanomicrobiales archaeon]|nr:thioredoxin domain-containing protein [Methanomicrobiales archaeon]
MIKQPPKTNRLIREKSPYLLEHAGNPVDWYPWGDEAFLRAKRENKPVFVSIGYLTCHWCHVMAHESFEDPDIAVLLNRAFISVKVDREERPDIDKIYMEVCQLMTGRGGWPLTIIMTAEKQPFFAATYIPRETRRGMLGLLDLLPRLEELWKTGGEDLRKLAFDITETLQNRMAGPTGR